MPPKAESGGILSLDAYVALTDEFLIQVRPGILQIGIGDVRKQLDAGGHRVKLQHDFLLRGQVLDCLGVDRSIGVILAGILVADAGRHGGLLLSQARSYSSVPSTTAQ